MKNAIFTILFLFLAINTMAANTKSVDEKADCLIQADILGRGVIKTQTEVYVDEQGNFYIKPHIPKSSIPLRGFLSKEQYKGLIAALEKGLNWARKAKENKLETTKIIAPFMIKEGLKNYGVNVVFASQEAGEEVYIGLLIIDFDNPYSKGTVLFTPEQTVKLIAMVKKLPAALRALKEEEKRADDILK